MSVRWSFTLVLGLVIVPSFGWAADWSQFRGPLGSCVADTGVHPMEWAENSNVAWKVPIPGHGWSQPIVAGDKIFVTTAIAESEDKPQVKDGRPFVPEARDATQDEYRWNILCLSALTGELLWQETAFEGKPRHRKHRNNTYASETPVTDGQRVIAYFGEKGVACYDSSGKQLWSKQLGGFPMQAGWGTGSSPVIYGDAVFIQCDNNKASFLIALDKRTGEQLWRKNRSEKSNWSSPYIWQNKLRTELVVAGGQRTCSHDPASGEELWTMAASGRTSVTPIGDDELIYVDSVHQVRGSPGRLAAIRAGASGDISLPNDDDNATSNEFVVWSTNLKTYRNASPTLFGGCLYMLEQGRGSLRCFDAKTGNLHYTQRLPDAVGFFASPWVNDGKVYMLDNTGLTLAIEPGPRFNVLAANRLDDEMFWASAAVFENRLLLRGIQHLYCIHK